MTPARLLVNVASPFPCPSYVTFPTMAIAAPPMAPVPEFTYVPLRVAWEHCGGGTCDLTAEVVRNTVTIAPSVAKPFAVRLSVIRDLPHHGNSGTPHGAGAGVHIRPTESCLGALWRWYLATLSGT